MDLLGEFQSVLRPVYARAKSEKGFADGDVIKTYTLEDFVLWTFAFSGTYRNYAVMTSQLPGLYAKQVQRKYAYR